MGRYGGGGGGSEIRGASFLHLCQLELHILDSKKTWKTGIRNDPKARLRILIHKIVDM